MIRKIALGLLFVIAGLGIVAFATAPAALVHLPSAPELPDNVVRWLENSEADVSATTPIVDGAEKRIRWFGDLEGQRSEYVVVYLHGFSATRQEIAPVGEIIADALEANMFETRLEGHGLAERALTDASAEDWLVDGVESLAVGRALGEKIVLIGTSTGATLALAMLDHELFERGHPGHGVAQLFAQGRVGQLPDRTWRAAACSADAGRDP